MTTRTLEADYLVIGAGAAGMAFTDALIADSDARVVMVDRRHAPGGHWHDAYPFVRLHQPSAFYGVNSLPLGEDRIDRNGSNAGHYERASCQEIVVYYRRVMDEVLLPSGRVRYFPMCEYLDDGRFASRLTGDTYQVTVRGKVVDGRYLEPAIPATHKPGFSVAPEARCVPVNDLIHLSQGAERLVIIGSGKTAIDACLWLLDNGVPPDDITWIRPRDAWLANRNSFQPGELAIECFSILVECAAQVGTTEEFFARLEAVEQFFRLDEAIAPTMFKYATVNALELKQLRSIRHVVRLGRVRRIERDAIVLDGGTMPTSPRHLHVHCAAPGLNAAPAVPVFADGRITLQAIRPGATPFAAAITGYVAATRHDLAEMNALCPPNPLPDVPLDLVRMTLTGLNADYRWSREPDIADWLQRARLNQTRGVMQRAGEPRIQQALARFARCARQAALNLQRMQTSQA